MGSLLLPTALFLAAKLTVLLLAGAVLSFPDDYVTRLSTNWDGIQYLRIAQHGYIPFMIPELPYPFGFAPFFPVLVRLGGAGDLSPFWVSNLTGVLAIAFVGLLMGKRAACFLAVFPTWLAYSSMGYSESPFVMFAALALLLLSEGKGFWAGGVASTAVATRYPGALYFLAFGLACLPQPDRRRRIFAFLSVLALGGFAILGWLWWVSGSPFSFVSAQGIWWDSRLATPWEQASWLLNGWFVRRVNAPPGYALIRNYAFTVPVALGTWYLLQAPGRRALGAFCLAAVILTLCMTGMPAFSMPRLQLGAFPALAILGDRVQSPAAWIAYIVAGILGAIWIVVTQLNGFFA